MSWKRITTQLKAVTKIHSSNDEIQCLLCRRPTLIAIKSPSRQSIIYWVASAWNKIEQHRNNAAKSFVVTGIAADLDRSEDDLMRNAEVQEEISAKQGNPKIWTPTLPAVIHSVMMKPVTMISQFLLS